MMRTQRFLVALTMINLALLIIRLLSRPERAVANAPLPVLRGSALEIVDERGKVRPSIKVQPAETFEPTGRKYPETVVLRLRGNEGTALRRRESLRALAMTPSAFSPCHLRLTACRLPLPSLH
jgi:hypothetical protein